MTPTELLAFEEDIAQEFAAGKIKAPVHLSGGNEQQLIEIFEEIKPWDWVLAGWRSHYHCLLKGVPPEELKTAIMQGRSVSLTFPTQKILCSGIAGGIAPIATGIGWAIRERENLSPHPTDQRVWCFLGDMSSEMGIVHEAMKYSARHSLPVRWIIEDNHKSVMTDTSKAWGHDYDAPWVRRYTFELTRPHVGIGVFVKF